MLKTFPLYVSLRETFSLLCAVITIKQFFFLCLLLLVHFNNSASQCVCFTTLEKKKKEKIFSLLFCAVTFFSFTPSPFRLILINVCAAIHDYTLTFFFSLFAEKNIDNYMLGSDGSCSISFINFIHNVADRLKLQKLCEK